MHMVATEEVCAGIYTLQTLHSSGPGRVNGEGEYL